MKGLLFFPLNFEFKELIGIQKKTNSQIDAFKKKINCDVIKTGNSKFFLNDSIVYNSIWPNIFFYNFLIYSGILKSVQIKDYDFIYMRYPMSNYFLVRFFRKIKKLNPEIKIFVEIPTYPYDKEGVNLKRKIVLFIDKLFQGNLQSYVDLIVTHYGQSKIFNIPTYNMGNGVSDDLLFSKKKAVVDINKMRFLVVANFSFYHGVDRLIKGVAAYYNSKTDIDCEIVVDLVGDGPELFNLKKQVNDLKLENYFIFHGLKYGESLEKLYEKADIGVSTLAWHRTNVAFDSSIKSREYCIKGVPFISCAKDFDFHDNFPFRMEVGLNDSPIDIKKVINFINKVRLIPEYSLKMNEYAMRNLTWSSKIEEFIVKNLNV